MTANFFSTIDEQLRHHPDAERIVWPESDGTARVYTGRDILDRLSAIRLALTGAGLQPGQSVLLAAPVSFDMVSGLLAIMAAGAIPVLPPASATPRTLLVLAVRSNVRVLLTRRKMGWLTRRLLRLFSIMPIALGAVSGAGCSGEPGWLPAQPVDPDQPALVSHSSGSTGRAKAVRRSHGVLRAQHLALSQAFPPWAGQRDFPLFPNVLLHNLATGTVSILPDLPGFQLAHIDPARVARQLADHRIQTLTGNVYYFQQLLVYCQAQSLRFPAVRAVGIGGSPVPEGLAQSLRAIFSEADIFVIYGSSEAEPIAIRRVGAEPWNRQLGYWVGTIDPAIQVTIRPVGTLTLPDGSERAVGEIGVKGAHVATAGSDWLWTGDFGYLDPANGLFLTGRRGNEQIHRGIQHYQLEHQLTTVPGIRRVAARATDGGFEVYMAGTAAENDVWQALADHFPPNLVTRILVRQTLPVDARHQSKIRYDALR